MTFFKQKQHGFGEKINSQQQLVTEVSSYCRGEHMRAFWTDGTVVSTNVCNCTGNSQPSEVCLKMRRRMRTHIGTIYAF